MKKLRGPCVYSYHLYVNFFVWQILLLLLIFLSFFFFFLAQPASLWLSGRPHSVLWQTDPFSAKHPKESAVCLLLGAPALLIKLIPLLDLKNIIGIFFIIIFVAVVVGVLLFFDSAWDSLMHCQSVDVGGYLSASFLDFYQIWHYSVTFNLVNMLIFIGFLVLACKTAFALGTLRKVPEAGVRFSCTLLTNLKL